MTEHYLKNARNFTIHQPSAVHIDIYSNNFFFHTPYNIIYNEKRSKKIKGKFFDYHPSSSSLSSSNSFFRRWSKVGFTRFNNGVFCIYARDQKHATPTPNTLTIVILEFSNIHYPANNMLLLHDTWLVPPTINIHCRATTSSLLTYFIHFFFRIFLLSVNIPI